MNGNDANNGKRGNDDRIDRQQEPADDDVHRVQALFDVTAAPADENTLQRLAAHAEQVPQRSGRPTRLKAMALVALAALIALAVGGGFWHVGVELTAVLEDGADMSRLRAIVRKLYP